MENTKTYIKEITDEILDLYFSQVDSLSLLIHSDPKRASRIIVNVLRRTLNEFEKYAPLIGTNIIQVNNGSYTFKNNYLDVFEGRTPIEDLELIPLTIARVSIGNKTLNANTWSYNSPVLECFGTHNSLRVDAIYHYPLVINFTKDGYLHKESHIFGLDEKSKDMLLNICELRMLERIKSNYERISVTSNIKFMDLENDITSLKEKVEEDKGSSSSLRLSWR